MQDVLRDSRTSEATYSAKYELKFDYDPSTEDIRGGERTSEGQKVMRRRRPRMTAESLKNLLQRHGKEILEEEEAEDRLQMAEISELKHRDLAAGLITLEGKKQ